jgi:hypothetical protein
MTHKSYIKIQIEVEFNATPFVPARTDGPAENCSPSEGGEVEIESIEYNGKPIELSEADQKKVQEEIEQGVADGDFDREPYDA